VGRALDSGCRQAIVLPPTHSWTPSKPSCLPSPFCPSNPGAQGRAQSRLPLVTRGCTPLPYAAGSTQQGPHLTLRNPYQLRITSALKHSFL